MSDRSDPTPPLHLAAAAALVTNGAYVVYLALLGTVPDQTGSVVRWAILVVPPVPAIAIAALAVLRSRAGHVSSDSALSPHANLAVIASLAITAANLAVLLLFLLRTTSA